MISIHFDDIIYKLQRFGGASEYWANLTQRVASSSEFVVTRDPAHKLLRWIPTSCSSQIFHSSHFRNTYSKNAVTVSTVHDMNYELGYLPNNLGARVNILERKLSYFSSHSLICISESTKRELLQVYPQLEGRCVIEVIHHGCEFTPASPEYRKQTEALGPYILFVGGRQNYKRFDDVLHAFIASNLKKEGFKIVCTGGLFTEVELDEIKRLDLSQHVQSLGKVTQAHLSALYESAYCLVYPSVHEGFGMPLIEAMQHSCPVIACDISCIPEITSDAAILVRAQSPDEISSALLKLSDSKVRAEFIEKGLQRANIFSWDKSAASHMAVYRQAAHEK